MSSSTNLTSVQDLESASTKAKEKYTELNNRIGSLSGLATTDKSSIVAAINEAASSGGGGLEVPASDNKVYVMKNGAWVEAILVEQPSEWAPAINDQEDIVLTLDDDMNPYQLTGINVEE